MAEVNINELITACYFSSLEPIVGKAKEGGLQGIIRFVDEIKNGLPKYIDAEKVKSIISGYFEKSNDDLTKILNMASYSAGGVCESETDSKLISISTDIRIKGDEPKKIDKGKALFLPLEYKDSFQWFFNNSETSKERTKEELIAVLKRDIQTLKEVSEAQYCVSFDAVFENYVSNVGCGVPKLEDVSLWQYARLKAAFCEALFIDKMHGIDIFSEDCKQFRFVSGDASGIQKYIFNLKKNKMAAKLLRAKSFQIWIQSLEVANKVAENFGSSYLSIISFSGGRFLLVLPNLTNATDILTQQRKEIEEYFVDKYFGILAFIISEGAETSWKDVRDSGMELQKKIGNDLNRMKLKKLQIGLGSNFKRDDIFEEIKKTGGVCDFCEEHAAPLTDESSEERCCRYCKGLMNTGRKLTGLFDGKNHTISIKRGNISDNLEFMIDRKGDDADGSVNVFALSSFVPGIGRLLIPYIVPVEKDDVMTFEDLEKQSEGNNKLAMFKADVDFLGLVFGASFGENWSLARYAELSMRMHAFFADALRRIIQDNFRNSVYVVFSGGDDVCVIGPWSQIIAFAELFHDVFERFTNENPSLTLSAGIELFSSSTPLTQVVNLAEEALEQSKKYQEGKKNAITLFGRTIDWQDFSDQIRNAEKLKTLSDGDETSKRGFVYRLIGFSDRAWRIKNEKGKTNQRLYDLMWQSHYAYALGRMKDLNKKDKETTEFLKSLRSDAKKMETVRVAASIAVYSNRNKEKEDFI